jgi:hypothetical protein
MKVYCNFRFRYFEVKVSMKKTCEMSVGCFNLQPYGRLQTMLYLRLSNRPYYCMCWCCCATLSCCSGMNITRLFDSCLCKLPFISPQQWRRLNKLENDSVENLVYHIRKYVVLQLLFNRNWNIRTWWVNWTFWIS